MPCRYWGSRYEEHRFAASVSGGAWIAVAFNTDVIVASPSSSRNHVSAADLRRATSARQVTLSYHLLQAFIFCLQTIGEKFLTSSRGLKCRLKRAKSWLLWTRTVLCRVKRALGCLAQKSSKTLPKHPNADESPRAHSIGLAPQEGWNLELIVLESTLLQWAAMLIEPVRRTRHGSGRRNPPRRSTCRGG